MEYLSFCAFGAIAESIWIFCTRLQSSATVFSAVFTCVLLNECRDLEVLVVKLCDVVFANYCIGSGDGWLGKLQPRGSG